ncbi:MAG: MFS transporter [Sebaldella sp.]|nr:MFS transporter [Sebaldella sp.]
MHSEKNLKSINIKFSAIQCTFMMSLSAILGFSVILLQSRDFKSSEIGVILAIECIASVFSQTILGSFADKHKNILLKYIVIAVLIVSFIANLLLMFIPSTFWTVALIFTLIGMSEYSATSLINSLAIQFVNIGIPINFGLARGLGSFSYAIAGLMLGKLIVKFGAESILPVHGLFLFLVIIAVLLFNRPDKFQKTNVVELEETEKSVDKLWVMILNNKALFYFLVSIVLIFISHGMLANFLPQIIEHVGGNSGDYGTAMFLAAMSEIPTMVFFSFFMRKTTSGKLVILSFFFFFIKSLLFYFSNTIPQIFAFQMLQILGYGLFVPASVYYVNEIVSENEKIKGQSLVTVASMGVGITIGNLLGGVTLDVFGVSTLLIFSTIFSFLGFLITFLTARKKKIIYKN